MFRGHTGGAVNDTAFDPFDDNRIASAGDDCKIKLWKIPDGYTYIHNDPENIVDIEPQDELSGHSRKLCHLSWNPVAKNVLASSGKDYSVKIWNVDTKNCEVILQHKDEVTSFAWNYNGTQIVTSSRDKKLRIWDARSGIMIQEGPGHTGAKSTRVVWLGNTNRIASTGFDRFSERQIGLWNAENLSAGPIGGLISVDSSSGILMPFFDPSTNILFIAGKGDGNVRYYEFSIENDDIYELSQYASTDPQRGFAVAPKRTVNVKENEIIRAYKLLNDRAIEPVSFICPRRAESFQDDIYPDAPSAEPAMSAEEFFNGKVVLGPIMCSMRDIYTGDTPTLSKTTTAPISVGKVQKNAQPESKLEATNKPTEPEPTKIVKEVQKSTPTEPSKTESNLKEDKVGALLEKLNELSDDDDTQDVDGNAGDEWDDKPAKAKESSLPKENKNVSKPLVKSKSEPETKEVKTEPVPKEAKSEEEQSIVVSAEVKPTKVQDEPFKTNSDDKAKPAAGGLKANLEKLHQLSEKMETTFSELSLLALDKSQREKDLEERVLKLETQQSEREKVLEERLATLEAILKKIEGKL